MRQRSRKPIRKCHSCLLNLGTYCWGYMNPRERWANRACPAFENKGAYAVFVSWQTDFHGRSRRQIRRDIYMSRKQAPRAYLERRRGTRYAV